LQQQTYIAYKSVHICNHKLSFIMPIVKGWTLSLLATLEADHVTNLECRGAWKSTDASPENSSLWDISALKILNTGLWSWTWPAAPISVHALSWCIILLLLHTLPVAFQNHRCRRSAAPAAVRQLTSPADLNWPQLCPYTKHKAHTNIQFHHCNSHYTTYTVCIMLITSGGSRQEQEVQLHPRFWLCTPSYVGIELPLIQWCSHCGCPDTPKISTWGVQHPQKV